VTAVAALKNESLQASLIPRIFIVSYNNKLCNTKFVALKTAVKNDICALIKQPLKAVADTAMQALCFLFLYS